MEMRAISTTSSMYITKVGEEKIEKLVSGEEPSSMTREEKISLKMWGLMMSFPSLARKVQGWEVFDATLLDKSKDVWSSGERKAAQFVLAVWNHYDYKFDAMDALSTWDTDHRKAFLKWANNPWWA